MPYKLLVFDWDGTIIDSASTIAECIRDASRDLGLEVPDRERASHVIGLGLHDAMRIAVPGLPARGCANNGVQPNGPRSPTPSSTPLYEDGS